MDTTIISDESTVVSDDWTEFWGPDTLHMCVTAIYINQRSSVDAGYYTTVKIIVSFSGLNATGSVQFKNGMGILTIHDCLRFDLVRGTSNWVLKAQLGRLSGAGIDIHKYEGENFTFTASW